MKIDNVISLLNEHEKEGTKLSAVKLVNNIRGGGLKESKKLVDLYFKQNNGAFGSLVINHLKNTEDWTLIKSNIRKLTYKN